MPVAWPDAFFDESPEFLHLTPQDTYLLPQTLHAVVPLYISPPHPCLALAAHKHIGLALTVPVPHQFLISFQTSHLAAYKVTVEDPFITGRFRRVSLLLISFRLSDVFGLLS